MLILHVDDENSQKLLGKLGGLPLALAQASAFMRETGSSFADYIEFYEKEWKFLMKSHDDEPLRDYPNRSVWTTWNLSYDAVRKRST